MTRILLLLVLAAIATPAQAVAMQYMEIDGGKVVLFGRCTPVRNNWCDCPPCQYDLRHLPLSN